MNQDKTIFIIPGYKHKATHKAYKEIAKILKSEGYRPITINISWRKSTVSQNAEYFLKKYSKIDSKKKYILGFSFGAMIAFIVSTKVPVNGLILCSLSPYFKEDLVKDKDKWISPLTVRRYLDFSNLRCSILAKRTKAKNVHMLYGTRESRILIKRVRKAYAQISSRRKCLTAIKRTEHNIGDKRYLYAIHKIAKGLN